MTAFLSDEKIQENLDQLYKDWDQFLNESGVIIIEPPICEDADICPEGTSLAEGTCLSCGACREWDQRTPGLDGRGICIDFVNLYEELGMCNGAKGVACEHD
eukprot:SAG11_NODE_17785_length_509_cov_0.621951_1_plen_101_part_10